MRGNQTFTALFPSSVAPKPEQKGHRNIHIDRRDDAIAIRFYYYHHLVRSRYDDILLYLEREFFITPDVVSQRLKVRTEYMRELSRKEPKISDLKMMLPFFSWN